MKEQIPPPPAPPKDSDPGIALYESSWQWTVCLVSVIIIVGIIGILVIEGVL